MLLELLEQQRGLKSLWPPEDMTRQFFRVQIAGFQPIPVPRGNLHVNLFSDKENVLT